MDTCENRPGELIRRGPMNRFLTSALILAAAITLVSIPAAAQTAQGTPARKPDAPGAARPASTAKGWAVPKTPWGDPDLQGTWTSDDCIGTPMQRPANIGDRLYLTEQELAQRESQLARQAENDKQVTVASDARVGVGPPGHCGERARRPCRQTSLVVDPPNGRIPELTADAKGRRIPEGAGNDN